MNEGGIKGNAYKTPRQGGKRKYENAEKLAEKIDEYFEYIQGSWHEEATDGIVRKVWDRQPEPATITRLAIYLGFSTRQGLLDYNENEEFEFLIKHAKTMVESYYELQLSSKYPTGAVFALKNLGWTENKTVHHTGLPEGAAPVINVMGANTPPLADTESEING